MLKVSCKVPQGSSLGPQIFLPYINDLPQVSWFNITLFADDTLLTLNDKNLNNFENNIKAISYKILTIDKKTSHHQTILQQTTY